MAAIVVSVPVGPDTTIATISASTTVRYPSKPITIEGPMTRTYLKRTLLISMGLVIGGVGVVIGFRLLSAKPATVHRTDLADCQRRAAAARGIATQFAMFHAFPPSMKSLSTQPVWSDACQPGEPHVADATLDLSGQATNATVDAFYDGLFTREGWRPDGSDPQVSGAARYVKEIEGVRYSADVIFNQWTGKQNITIQLSYSP